MEIIGKKLFLVFNVLYLDTLYLEFFLIYFIQINEYGVIIMYLSDAIRSRIKYYQDKKNMSLWALFKSSGVPMSTLAAFMSKRTELVKLDTLLHICEGFGITLTEFFEDDIFKEVEQD